MIKKNKGYRKKKKKSISDTLLLHCRRWMQRGKLLLVLVALACCGIYLFNTLTAPDKAVVSRVTAGGSSYDGIDVSKYQGSIDWSAVAQDQNIKFVYIKATEGATVVDKRYAENVRKAKAAGLKIGSYHYFIARKSARDQFYNFRRQVNKSHQDLIPVVDVESAGNSSVSRARLQQTLNDFMQLMKQEYGKYPILYSQYGFYNRQLAPEFNRYYIFIARYGTSKPTLKGGGNYNIWQYTEKGRIKGIKGTVDLDRLENGTSMKDLEL